ncbi:MAG: CotH kinase family protein, partial [Lachnospiraceae bacterium]|nr:CotH kinase family protein [Lachnospiraceae bacterium]
MKNKIGIIIICAVVAFVAIISAFVLNEQSNDFMNMEKATEEQMEVLIAGKEEKYVNVNVVTFNGYSISADKNENTLYICQNINEKNWQGELITNDGNKLYVLSDELMNNKTEAIKQAHRFKAYSIGETSYSDFDLIFTGLSTINFHAEEKEDELSTGRLVITDTIRGELYMERPLDIYGSLKEKKKKDNLPGHVNYKMELFADEHGRSYDSALLGMREDDDWELDSVMENEYAQNGKLAYSIWNEICDKEGYEGFKTESEYAYLFVDDVKVGLYLVRVPYDKRQLKLNNSDSFEEWDRLETASYTDPDEREFIDYSLFIQLVYAPKNLVKNKYILEKDIGEGRRSYKLPRHLEYLFEYLPDNLTEYTDTVGEELYSYVLNDPDVEALKKNGAIGKDDVKNKWNELRKSALSDETIFGLFNEQYNYLENTGFVAACSFDDNVNVREQFKSYLSSRLEFLDSYYENDQIIPAGKITVEDIKASYNGKEVSLYKANDGYYAFMPAYTDLRKTELIIPDGIEINFKDDRKNGFKEGHKYEFSAVIGDELATDTLTFMKSENLPAMFIETKSKSLSYILADSEYSEPGKFEIINADGEEGFKGEFKKLKGHGRSSWILPLEKKAFNMILYESERLMEAGASRHWVLLANSRDGAFIRNKLTYDIAAKTGMRSTPQSSFCDLYINGKYAGNYQLCQKFEISEDVLDITDLDELNAQENPTDDIKTIPTLQWDGRRGVKLENNPTDITGGYLIQGNRSRKYVVGFFHSNRDYRVEIKFPEFPSVEETDYIYNYFQLAEDAVYAPDGINPETGIHYSDYIDVESFAKKYLIDEYSKNVD